MSTSGFERVLAGFRQRIAEEDARMRVLKHNKADMQGQRDSLLLPVGEEVAQLLVDLAVGLRGRHGGRLNPRGRGRHLREPQPARRFLRELLRALRELL